MEGKFESTPSPEYVEIFHKAQELLLLGDVENSKAILQEVIAKAALENDDNFVWYAKGTLAYADRDQAGLQEAIARLGENPNAEILGRFLAKIESGDDLDYSQDYGQGKI